MLVRRLLGLAAALLSTLVFDAAAAPAALRGVLHSGGTTSARPLADVEVTLFEATTARPVVVGRARTDASGRFTIAAPNDRAQGMFYVSAMPSAQVELLAVLGPVLPADVIVNELTTVAASYATAQLSRGGVIAGEPLALRIAAAMNGNLVDVAAGVPSPVLLGSPNADQTNSLRSTRSLANLLAACTADPAVTRQLLALVRGPRGPQARTTAEALAELARDPGRGVQGIYLLSLLRDAYGPALARAPDAWTLTVKVNDSGDDSVLFGGPGNLAFDDRGYAWVTNNVVQGGTPSSTSVMVLRPDGRPADGSAGTPRSPLTAGGILGTGFGVAAGPRGDVWFGNFGWGGVEPTREPPGNGSLSRFAPDGTPLSGTSGIFGGPYRAQGLAVDARGNLWISSFGNDSVYVFAGGDPSRATGHRQYHGSQPFDIAIAPDGSAWVSNSGGLTGEHASSVARFTFERGELKRSFLLYLGQALKALAVDSNGNAWVASLGDNSVYGIRPDGTLIGRLHGGGIDGPWGVSVDGDDNLWVTSFGSIQPDSNFGRGRLSKFAGTKASTRPPGTKAGEPISPPTGYTLPSAGSQVLLHDGTPLYGPAGPPSFAPMMRQTAAVIDRAGNVWTVNNYKPDLTIDLLRNPGGDGIVIFVGLAPPPGRAGAARP